MPDHSTSHLMSPEFAKLVREEMLEEDYQYALGQIEKAKKAAEEPLYVEEAEPQQGGLDYDSGPRQRWGNNKAPFRKEVTKRKAKLAKASKKRNRK